MFFNFKPVKIAFNIYIFYPVGIGNVWPVFSCMWPPVIFQLAWLFYRYPNEQCYVILDIFDKYNRKAPIK